jgi:hypothetical protein
MGGMVGTVVGITHNVLGGKSYFGVNENSTEYTDSLIGLYTSRASIFSPSCIAEEYGKLRFRAIYALQQLAPPDRSI